MALITADHLEQQPDDPIVLFQAADGQVSLDVRLEADTVWLSQAQMAELFGRERSVITRHVGNVFREGELAEESNVHFLHIAGADRPVGFYSLDVIISVGYRVKSPRGSQFRIWATQVLRQHLIQGYTLHQRRLQERGLGDLQQALALMARTLSARGLVGDEGQAVLEVVQRYSRSWRWLLAYDEDRLAPAAAEADGLPEVLGLAEAQRAIATLRADLAGCGEATPLLGQDNRQALAGILGAIEQTFDGQPLYPTAQLRAAHLLYFVIKDHPFADGNKRRQRHGSSRPADRRKRSPTERPDDSPGDGPAGGSAIAMTPAQPFALRLFVPSGLPEGMRIVEKSNWSGIGFVVPRSQLAEFLVRPEAQRPGVYVLLGPEPDGSGDLAYIGEADDTAWLSQAQMAEPPCPIHLLHTCHASRSTASPTAWESFPSRLSSR